MTFRTFREEDMGRLYRSFVDAFSDYRVPLALPFEAFQIRILHKLHLDPALSLLAFGEDQCLGFILHTTGPGPHGPVAYNGGTGVVPAARGKNLTIRLYETLLPSLVKRGIRKVILEVLTTNLPAIKVYEKLGFAYSQTYRCYKLPVKDRMPRSTVRNGITVHKVRIVDFKCYGTASSVSPSFIDQSQHLKHNLSHEITLEAYLADEWAGYVIFQPHLGRISQIAVLPDCRRKGVATTLIEEVARLSEKKELTVINVPEDYAPMNQFLLAAGFVNEVDQYEMELVI